LPEVVGDACIQVPVRDSQAIADAVAELFDDPERRAALARAGRERMENIFCWRKAALEMTDYYWQVIDRANR
ncbi:MAG TPA: glycosyltransferase family 1 protein, partial [Spongiibacteraceae bacterium]|nr:glycosyltransferase family 1 protein [Spongiibacteraceae bacterium]